MSTTRREFLAHSAALAAVATSACSSTSSTRSSAAAAPAPAFRISLAQWSLHDALFKQRLDPLDFPRASQREFGIDTVEYVNTFYKERKDDDAYFGQLKQRCRDEGVASRLIMVDGEGSLGAALQGERDRAVSNHKRWLEVAHQLGCMAIRVNAYGDGTPTELRDRVAESLHRLGALAAPLELYVIVENHGHMSSNGAWMAGLMARADHPRVGTLPDFGNFTLVEGQFYDRYRGVAEMLPWARAVSAKSYDFDAQGDETTIDYRRMLALVAQAGYREHLGIEYEGSRLSEHDGILATKALLVKIRDEQRPA